MTAHTLGVANYGVPSSVRGGYNLAPGQAAAAAVFYDQLVHAFTALGNLLD